MTDTAFKNYKNKFIKIFGRDALYDSQLTRAGRDIFGRKYIGTFSQDTMPTTSGYLIVNVDTSKKINTPAAHWVAIYQTKTRMYVYDSYGRSTKFVLPIIAKNTNKTIIESKRDPEQYGETVICGHLCLAWLCCVEKLGITRALKI